MRSAQMVESFAASSNDRRLQLIDRLILQTRRVGKKAGHTPDGGRQTVIGVELQVESRGISGHVCRLMRHRKLPGNPGNSKGRPHRGAR